MSQQQTRCSEIPVVTNSQCHKTDPPPQPCCPLAQSRESQELSLPLFGGQGGAGRQLTQSRFGLLFTRCFSAELSGCAMSSPLSVPVIQSLWIARSVLNVLIANTGGKPLP